MKPNDQNTHKALHALVVDDDDFMRDFVGNLLRELGVTDVKTARNGADGIRAFEEAAIKPDVILCDLKMPDTDGFQFMELISGRAFSGGFIVVSGMDARTQHSAALMAKFHRLNILGTVNKPVDRRALAHALAQVA